MREPVSASNRSRIFSRSRKAYISGVPLAPISCSRNPIDEAWFCTRVSSARITRRYSARSGTACPASFSTASA